MEDAISLELEIIYQSIKIGDIVGARQQVDLLLAKYPYMSEWLAAKAVILQLSDDDSIELSFIEELLEKVVSRNRDNLDAYIQLIAFQHLVLDDAHKTEKTLQISKEVLMDSLGEYIGLYSDFLYEQNRENEILSLREDLKKYIDSIPLEYSTYK